MSTIFHAHSGRTAVYRAWLIPSVIIWSVFATSGCTTGEPPTSTLIRAELGLRAAGEARAPEFAPMELQRAREKLEGSKRAMAAKNYEEARRLAESAQVEAELAEAKAEAEITRRAAEELRRSIDALRVETERRSTKPSSGGSAKE
jgi:hypothetical protein